MTPILTAGIGLKPEHYDEALGCAAAGMWYEIHAENYFVEGGPRLSWLQAIRQQHPLSVHGVGLSLASDQPVDADHLRQLSSLVRRFEPELVSEHLAWNRWGGASLPDLLPFPRTGKALLRVADNISRTQEALGRAIAIENPSHYLRVTGHDWSECDFLRELVRRTGCSLLLDVNNVFVSSRNLGLAAEDYLAEFPLDATSEIHLAGHSHDPALGAALLVDSHDAAVAPEVWALYRRVIEQAGPRPTLIERDANLPGFNELLRERDLAHGALLNCRQPEPA